MHGKNNENFKGIDITVFKYIDKPIKYENFGFDILFEEKEQTDKDNKITREDEDPKYEEGKKTKRFVEDFVDDTIICRSILNYWTSSKNNGYFKSRRIIEDWLLDNCQFFEKKYPGSKNKTNDPNKIEQNNSNVTFLLERLKYLSLLKSRPIESKNHFETQEYSFTELGKLVALLLKYNGNFDDSQLVKEIYTQTLKYYETQNSSFALFCMLFFSNCYKRDSRLFALVIILNLLHIIKEPPNNKDAVLNKLRNFPVVYDSEALFKVLINSLNEFRALFSDDYNKVIYNLKLGIESDTEKKCKNLDSFERLRLGNISGLHPIVLEGYCTACNRYTPVIIESMFSYFKESIKNKDNRISMDCPDCEGENTVSFEPLQELDYKS